MKLAVFLIASILTATTAACSSDGGPPDGSMIADGPQGPHADGGAHVLDAAVPDGTVPGGDAGGDGPVARPTHCLLVAVGSDTWLLREDGTSPVVLMGASHAQYTTDGSAILYSRDGAIRKRDNAGRDEQLVLAAALDTSASYPTESPGRDRFAYIRESSGTRSLHVMEYAGQPRLVTVALAGQNIESIAWPRWSPAGDRIALWFETRDASGENVKRLMVLAPDGTNARVVTSTQTDIERGDWIPDGTKLVHETDDKGIGWTDVQTQETRTLFMSPSGSVDDPVVSADGRGILYRKSRAAGGSELRLATLDGAGNVTRDVLLLGHESELAPADWNPACK